MKAFWKKKSADADPRRTGEPIAGGRRAGESPNPYLSARRTWNDHVASAVAARQMWQMLGLLSLMIALAGVAGVIHIGSQSKFVPYVVEVDKLGQSAAVQPAYRASPVDQRVLRTMLTSFISDARSVTPDGILQRRAIFRVYAMLSLRDPAQTKMTEWYSATEKSNPFKRSEEEMVSVEIASILPQSPQTWQIDWIETVRSRDGRVTRPPFRMRALMTIYIKPPTADTTEEQIKSNPLGIYVRDFSWSKQI